MARKMLLFSLFLIIIKTILHFSLWHRPAFHRIAHVEADLEDSIVLMQEKTINKLNELVRELKEELRQCRITKFDPTYSYVRKNSSKLEPT